MSEIGEGAPLLKSYSKFVEWSKLLTVTGSAQVFIQAIALVSGIFVIRTLPTEEYALYTLANTMLGTMTVLSDGGIATGVMAQGGKVWRSREDLGVVLKTGLYLRKKFATGSLIISIPILIFLLRHHHASWLMSVLIVAALIPSFYSTLSGSLLQVVPKLRQEIVPLQKNQVVLNIIRLVSLLLSLFLFPWAFVAILCAAPAQIYSNLQLRKIARNSADLSKQPSIVVQSQILSTVKKILPTSIYYCFSGQINLWIISLFGSTSALAQIGALSRLAMVISFFNVMFTTLIVPRFARLPKNTRMLIKKFLFIEGGLFAVGAFIVILVKLFSGNILWILGSDFAGLNNELVLMSLSSCISMVSLSTNQLLSARNMIIPPAILITCTVSIQVGLAFFLKLNEVSGVLLYGIYTTTSIYLIRITYMFFTIIKNGNRTQI